MYKRQENNITPLEAQALLAGIMLDTRSFALHVGVRTFEASAWLRSRGAQTADTKLLFNTSKEEYEARAHIVEAAYIYKGCAIEMCIRDRKTTAPFKMETSSRSLPA